MNKYNYDPREAMSRFPAFLQPFLTWLTSKALPGQQALFRHSWRTQMMTGFGLVFGGLLVSLLCLQHGKHMLELLPLLWLAMVCGARYLQTNILHQASHSRLTGNEAWDQRIGNFIGALILIAPFQLYKAAHMPHHTPGTFATIDDPDFRFFRKLGFEPGLPMPKLWRRFWSALFGVRSHWVYLRTRSRSNLVKSSRRQCAGTIALHLFIAALSVWLGGWPAYLLGWVFPMTILFQISAILQYITEHRWLLARRPEQSPIVHLNQLTIARFTGAMPPQVSARSVAGLFAWSGWWMRMLSYHLFCRIFIVQGPLGVHDFHHREPLNPKWPESVYERQRQIDSGNPRFADYQGVWGFHHSLRLSLQAISDFPNLPNQPDLTEGEVEAGYQSM